MSLKNGYNSSDTLTYKPFEKIAQRASQHIRVSEIFEVLPPEKPKQAVSKLPVEPKKMTEDEFPEELQKRRWSKKQITTIIREELKNNPSGSLAFEIKKLFRGDTL